jgi:hypothetical protein
MSYDRLCYALLFPDLYGQETTSKSGSPLGLGKLRISFIAPLQEGQHRIGRLSAKTMRRLPKYDPVLEE